MQETDEMLYTLWMGSFEFNGSTGSDSDKQKFFWIYAIVNGPL